MAAALATFSLLASALTVMPGATAFASTSGTDGSYLALGDSVTFGYREPATLPPPNYSNPSSFISYANDVGTALDLKVVNASCPGETSASMIVQNVQSNGCENSPGGGPGYRTAYPLHVSYSGTQLQFAVGYLKSHPDTRLVTLMIGANDAFLCEETTPDHCASELPAVLKQIHDNVTLILTAIRHEAGYHGRIVLLTYYSLNYSVPLDDLESQLLDRALTSGHSDFNAVVASGYKAFEAAAAGAGGDSCAAGLLTQLTTGGCGVHPSLAGQAVLATAVERAANSNR